MRIQARFALSGGNDPIFRLVDGATCPNDNVSTRAAKLQSYKLLLKRGLIRIGLSLPPGLQFKVINVVDPYNCSTNSATGLTQPDERNLVDVPTAAACSQSRIPVDDHVGRPRAKPYKSGD